MARKSIALVFASLAVSLVSAHHDGHRYHARHLKPTPTLARRADYPSGPQYDVPTPIDAIKPTDPNYSENTIPVMATYAGGSQPSLAGAPPLPDITGWVSSNYPDRDKVPPTDSPEVDEWYNAIDWSTIPDIPPNASKDCSDPNNAAAFAARGADGNCWWTCGGCTRDIDITTCSSSMDYGHGYDDGPGFYTNKLLTYLESKNLKATFFLVGSRVRDRPEIVQYEYMTGHELSVHTWSHGGAELKGLTMLTNREIVAELGWTKKVIKDATGVTPLTMRPPYGDIDDRVRAISLAMGLVPVVWTTVPNGAGVTEFDSNDWRVHGGNVQAAPNQQSFQALLDTASQYTDHGIIALQHDIYVEAVNLAIGYTLPYLLNHSPAFNIKPIMQCQGLQDKDAYLETNSNLENPAISGSGDVATRTSNIGYAAQHHNIPSSVPSRTFDTSANSAAPTGTGSGSGSRTGTGTAASPSQSAASRTIEGFGRLAVMAALIVVGLISIL